MSSHRWIAAATALLLLGTVACNVDPEEDPVAGGGTSSDDGRFTPPAASDDNSSGSNTTGAGTSTEPTNGNGNDNANGSNAKPAPPASTEGTCGNPRCFGGAGICGCQGGSGAGATILACIGGKCRCGSKTVDAAAACGQTPDDNALRALFATCGCK